MEGLIKLTVDNGDSGKLELLVPDDSDIYEWQNNVRAILKWLTFNDKTINEILKDEESEN